jgi:hypothetical protein
MDDGKLSWFDVAAELLPFVQKGDTSTAIARASAHLSAMPKSPFHIVMDVDFTNSPVDVASKFDAFIREQQLRFDVRAVYTETNGFDINPDEWYFDLFGYRDYGGIVDFDWISSWDSNSFASARLTGMESLQDVYASGAVLEKRFRRASEFCSLLVVYKFQSLIARSVPLMTEVKFPVLATCHDYDFVAEFRR